MARKVGRLAKVVLGTTTIGEMGKWSLDGITMEMLDASAFGDEFKEYEIGMGDYGTVSFGGWYDPADTNQSTLIAAHLNKSKIGNAIKFYVDNTSYWTPNVTNLSAAGILIQSIKIGFDKGGIGNIEVTAQCTGPWVLV